MALWNRTETLDRTERPTPDAPAASKPSGSGHHTETPQAVGLFEPPEGRVMSALGRNFLLIAFCALVLAAAGVAVGMTRSPVYTASATLQVGQVNPNSPGFLGYEQSATALASAFSRAIAAGPVLDEIEVDTGIARAKAAKRLSAEPIPLSPAFRVIATGPSAGAATELANAASKAIVAYEGKSNSANPEAAAQLSDYKEASVELHRAEAKVGSLEGKEASSEERISAEAELSAARVRKRAIGNAYVATVATQAPRKGLVSLLAGATSSTNDRKSKTELLGLIGLLAGAAFGCVVAIARESRRERRRRAAKTGA